MPRTTGSDGEKTAARIKSAAVKLFAQSGFAAVSMRRIADAAQIQVGGIYNYFPTKQDLLVSTLVEHLETLLETWQDQSSQPDDPRLALEEFVKFHIRFHADKSDAVFISYMELRNLEGANFKQVQKLRRTYEDQLRAILQAGCNRGIFTIEDVPVCAMALIAMLNGFNNWYRDGGRLPFSRIEKIYLQMALGCAGYGIGEKACSQPA